MEAGEEGNVYFSGKRTTTVRSVGKPVPRLLYRPRAHGRNHVQGVPKLVTQNSAVTTRELEIIIWSGTFQKLRLVLKYQFKPPDGISIVQSCLETCKSSWSRVPVGRGGTIAWLLRSSDLTPLHFSVWCCVKDKGFVRFLPARLQELRARITETVAGVNADMIHMFRVCKSVHHRTLQVRASSYFASPCIIILCKSVHHHTLQVRASSYFASPCIIILCKSVHHHTFN